MRSLETSFQYTGSQDSSVDSTVLSFWGSSAGLVTTLNYVERTQHCGLTSQSRFRDFLRRDLIVGLGRIGWPLRG